MSKILGVDGGLANLGLSVVTLTPTTMSVECMTLITTEKASKKVVSLASEDNVKRTQEVARALENIMSAWKIQAICAESMSYPRNSSAAAKMSLCWGALATLAEIKGIPIVQASPQQVKLSVCGRKDASKEDIQEALKLKFKPQKIEDLVSGLAKSKWEHPFDSLGAVVACLDSQLIKMLRNIEQEK